MHADVVVVNYHGADDVAGCLAALGPWRHGTVWLVDNSACAAQAAALQALAAADPARRVLVNPANLGFGAACNRAWATSDAPRVLLLNPDARIDAAAVAVLDAALDADRRLGAVSPRTWWDAVGGFLLPPPDVQGPRALLQPWALALRPGGAAAAAARRVQRERAAAARARVRPVAALAGALLLLDRAAVQAAGGLFDPGYFMFFEDADLSRRLRAGGRSLALVQTADAVHATCHTAEKAALMQASAQHYFERHHRLFLRAAGGLARAALPPWLAARADVAGARTAAAAAAAADAVAAAGAAGAAATAPGAGAAAGADAADAAGAGRAADVRGAQADGTGHAGGSAQRPAPRSAEALGPVLAFSPSPQGWPALARPLGQQPEPFGAAQWALLAPGEYRALVPDRTGGLRWVAFVRPPGAGDRPAARHAGRSIDPGPDRSAG